MTEPTEPIVYKGRIFDSAVSLHAWSIACRLEPDKSKIEERLGLAIAAQIGLNHDIPVRNPDSKLRRKLAAIQDILDDVA